MKRPLLWLPVGKGWVNKHAIPIVQADFLGACPHLLSPSKLSRPAGNRQMSSLWRGIETRLPFLKQRK